MQAETERKVRVPPRKLRALPELPEDDPGKILSPSSIPPLAGEGARIPLQGHGLVLRDEPDPEADLPLEERPDVSIGSGARYKGQWRGTRRHGHGRLVQDSGDIYEGQWEQNLAHGRGKYVYSDGGSYEGEWYRGEHSGKGAEVGSLRGAEDSRYEGDYLDGVKHGTGIWRSSRGAMYKGQFEDDEMHGEGCFKFVDSRLYTGQWRHGHMTGQGRMEWLAGSSQEGDMYEGQWDDDLAHGYGRYIHGDGGTYEGEWDQDLQSGRGVEYWPDGSRYEGEFYDGSKHGVGIWKGGETLEEYSGEFRFDEMEGEGRYSFADGRLYTGQWSQGRMSGQGEMRWPSGARYEGSWKEDKQHGEGILVSANGQVTRGQWVLGAPGSAHSKMRLGGRQKQNAAPGFDPGTPGSQSSPGSGFLGRAVNLLGAGRKTPMGSPADSREVAVLGPSPLVARTPVSRRRLASPESSPQAIAQSPIPDAPRPVFSL